MFHTDSDATWDGNLKKFALCDNEDPTVCTFGEVIDSNGDQAVDTDPSSADFGNLKDTAVGFWSTAGTSEITDQGAGSRVLDYTDRMVYAAESQAGTSLHLISNTDDASGANASSTYRTMLQDGSLPNSTVFCDDGSGGIDDACMDNLVGFQLGKRTNTAKQEQGIDANNRWAYTDGIHVRPLVMTFGGNEDNPISRLFIGSNDGSLRAINDGNSTGYDPTTNNIGGEEEWVLYPWQTLDRQMDLQNNVSSAAHIYGLDSTPTARVKDVYRRYKPSDYWYRRRLYG